MPEITLDEFRTPYCCAWQNKREAVGEDSYDYELFSSIDEAKTKYDEKRKDPALFVYLQEIGLFDKKSVCVDWITFRTNENAMWTKFGVEETNPLRSTRGYGMPESVEGLKKPYAVYYKIVDNPRKPNVSIN